MKYQFGDTQIIISERGERITVTRDNYLIANQEIDTTIRPPVHEDLHEPHHDVYFRLYQLGVLLDDGVIESFK